MILPTGYREKFIQCPHCKTVSNRFEFDSASFPTLEKQNEIRGVITDYEKCSIVYCPICFRATVIINDKIIYPDYLIIKPNPDMPEDTKSIYLEALSIANKSPRAACALLRLSIDRLVDYLGASKDKKLYEKIREVAKSPLVEDLLEACRLAGNKAVHPSQVVIEDNDIDLVQNLAEFINVVVDLTISMPKKALEIKNRFSKKDH